MINTLLRYILLLFLHTSIILHQLTCLNSRIALQIARKIAACDSNFTELYHECKKKRASRSAGGHAPAWRTFTHIL